MRTERCPGTPTPAELAARARRRRRGQIERLLTRGRVALALYRLSCADGLFVSQPIRRIAERAGRSETTTRAALNLMQAQSEIVIFISGPGLQDPLIFLADHPETNEMVDWHLLLRYELDSTSRAARAARAASGAPNPTQFVHPTYFNKIPDRD